MFTIREKSVKPENQFIDSLPLKITEQRNGTQEQWNVMENFWTNVASFKRNTINLK